MNGYRTDESSYSKLIDNHNNQPIEINNNDSPKIDIDYDQCSNRLCIGLANNDNDADDNSDCVGSKSCRALMSGLFIICSFNSIQFYLTAQCNSFIYYYPFLFSLDLLPLINLINDSLEK